MAQYKHCFQKTKQYQNSIFSSVIKLFPYILFQDIVVMAQALEKVFLSKVAQMPSEVNEYILLLPHTRVVNLGTTTKLC